MKIFINFLKYKKIVAPQSAVFPILLFSGYYLYIKNIKFSEIKRINEF